MSQKQAIYQINTNQHKPTQIKFKSTQIKTIQHKSIQTNTNQFKTKQQINTNQRKSIQIKTNQHKPNPHKSNQNKLIKTNQYKTKQSTQINTNEYKSHNVPNITKYNNTLHVIGYRYKSTVVQRSNYFNQPWTLSQNWIDWLLKFLLLHWNLTISSNR